MSATSLFGAAKATDLGRLATGFYTKVVDAATAGAFQIAVWEIVNEKNGNAYNLRGGSFKAFADSKQVQALAQDWLNNLPQANTYSLDIWHSPSHQDLAVFSALGEVMSPVPEPATVALVLAGLSLLGMARREEPKGIHKRG
ncbi:MAG: PEP-CTERM sorting domain-containing protein [Rhodocyclaceae bacterium]|nr:MAG: PEP-CTERM sorting domain-containing protein [Rhodocyclaceae bacterium]